MKSKYIFLLALSLICLFWSDLVLALDKSPARFEKGFQTFGAELGYGAGVNLPEGIDRSDIQFAHLALNYQLDLTGTIGKSFYQGNLNWFVEVNTGILHNPDTGYLGAISPLMFQYKFIKPERKWAPIFLAGAGLALTDWDEDNLAGREIGGDFQFLLHGGLGIEYFRPQGGSFSINYRFFHVSNAGTERPNVGLNANIFSIGFTF